MSNYIMAELDKTNAFLCSFSCKTFNRQQSGIIEIDTGASYSLIPFRCLGNSKEECRIAKELVIKTDTEKVSVLNGVECTNSRITKRDLLNMSFEEKMDTKAICFNGIVYNLSVDNYFIADKILATLNFDIDKSYALLGMDILKDFDMHIGKSLITGKITFLGCRKEDVSAEFIQAIQDHLGYVPIETMQLAYQQGYDQAQLARIEGIYTAACWRDYLRELKGEKKGLFRR